MSWSGLSDTQWVSRANLQDAISNSVFTVNDTPPPTSDTSKWIKKYDVGQYVRLDATNSYLTAKSNNQWVAKRDLTPVSAISCGTTFYNFYKSYQYVYYDMGTTSGTFTFSWTLNQHVSGKGIMLDIMYGGSEIGYTEQSGGATIVIADGSKDFTYTYYSGYGTIVAVRFYVDQYGDGSTYATSLNLSCPSGSSGPTYNYYTANLYTCGGSYAGTQNVCCLDAASGGTTLSINTGYYFAATELTYVFYITGTTSMNICPIIFTTAYSTPAIACAVRDGS